MSASIDIGPIIRGLNDIAHRVDAVNSNVSAMDGKVEFVARQQETTRRRLDELFEEFEKFRAADLKHKEKQYAATRIIEVRQEIEKRFGHYAEVRRTTTGILQATDVAIVRQETMRTATENLMLSTPGYWLAPALVALTAWVSDNRPLGEKALAEAILRDDSKTSLFFALVCRRASRPQANAQWLRRYFQIQNPSAMDREVVVMIDALANGVFGGAALAACSDVVGGWLAELEAQAGFSDEQRKRWAAALDVLAPKAGPREYPTLRGHSPTWPRLEASLSAARRNQSVADFFGQLFAGELIVPPTLEAAVDGLLDSLVTNFDDEELPLRREERVLQLVVEEDGDRDGAARRYSAESESFDEQTNFAAMLTNSAMSPQQFGATRATQRYAVSLSRQWILHAHHDLVARDRAQVPAEAEFNCGSWKGVSRDGSNEAGLVDDLGMHYAQRIAKAVEEVVITFETWLALIGGGLVGLILFFSGVFVAFSSGGLGVFLCLLGLLIAGVAVAYYYRQVQNLDRRREEARQRLEQERDEAAQILRACLAELTDLRRELAREDAKSSDVTDFLEGLSSPQFVLSGPDRQRSIVA
ncbi:MAG TPA: hypothetical protein VKB12_08555 [Pyrinomonadaceae bacterium]|nr:hypothetical protein [Pyrinomonadaceae bacterium]